MSLSLSHWYPGSGVVLIPDLCTLTYFAIILTCKRELVALLLLVSGCLITVNCHVALPFSAMVWSAVYYCGIS